MNGITEILEAASRNADEYFEWVQAHPKFGLLCVAVLLALWLTGLLLRWRWACHWQYNGKMWFFDDCKPETKRRIQSFLILLALIACMTIFFVWE